MLLIIQIVFFKETAYYKQIVVSIIYRRMFAQDVMLTCLIYNYTLTYDIAYMMLYSFNIHYIKGATLLFIITLVIVNRVLYFFHIRNHR